MNRLYPYTIPIVLTDDIFVAYGGNTGTTTVAQRNAAYFIAEERMSNHLGTLLQPTIVTGTYFYNWIKNNEEVDWAYVWDIKIVRFLDTKESVYHTISGTANTQASLRNSEYGIVDIHYIIGNCQGCGATLPWPYQLQIVYEAGLPTGTYTSPNMLLALTTVADIILNEIVGFGNEAPGDIGIQEFANQQYREKRVKLGKTGLGSSARANFAVNLVRSLKRSRPQYTGL